VLTGLLDCAVTQTKRICNVGPPTVMQTVDCYTKEISVSVYDLNDNNSIASDSTRSPHASSRAALPSASAVNLTSSPSVAASPAVRAPTPTPMPTSLRDCYNELERCLELYQHDNLVESFAVLNDLVRTLDQLSAQAALHDEGFMVCISTRTGAEKCGCVARFVFESTHSLTHTHTHTHTHTRARTHLIMFIR